MRKLLTAAALTSLIFASTASAELSNDEIDAPYPGAWTTFRVLTGDGNVEKIENGLDVNGHISSEYPGPWTTFRRLTGE